jgi:hypothetical protein
MGGCPGKRLPSGVRMRQKGVEEVATGAGQSATFERSGYVTLTALQL